jgi:hypothetical protein
VVDIDTVNDRLADLTAEREIEYTVLDDADDETAEHTVPDPVKEDPRIVDLEQDLQQARRDSELLVEFVQNQEQALNERTRELELTQRALQQLTDDHDTVTDLSLRTLGREQDLTRQVDALNQRLEILQQERDQLFSAHSYEMHRADELAQALDIIASVPQPVPIAGEEDPIDFPEESVSLTPEEIVEEIIQTLPARQPAADFGVSFPNTPSRGDMFLRTDFKPSRLFKWNDVKWIEINKRSTDIYNYNDAYIQYLAEKIGTGEYSVDDLSDIEIQQVNTLMGK